MKVPHQVHQHQNQKALDGGRAVYAVVACRRFRRFLQASFFMDLLHAWPKFFERRQRVAIFGKPRKTSTDGSESGANIRIRHSTAHHAA